MEKSLEAHLFECLEKGNTKKSLYIVQLMRDNVNKLYRGKSPLIWAKKFENEEVINALEEKGANEVVISKEEAEKLGKSLYRAAEVGDSKLIEQLIEAGANLDFQDEDGDTALRRASYYGHLEIVEKLLDAGADVNAKNIGGATSLQEASVMGRLEIVEKLLDAGADVNVQDEEGQTALVEASYYGYLEIVEKLLDAGADVNAKRRNGGTAISLAKDEKIRKAIIEAVKKKKEDELSFTYKMNEFFSREK